MKNLETEDAWLRFLLRRMRLGLRNAKSPETAVVLKELIAEAEERLDGLERHKATEPNRNAPRLARHTQ